MDASQPLITFEGANDIQEVNIRDRFRRVVLSGPQGKRTEGDIVIRENVGALLAAQSNGLGVYANGSPRHNGTLSSGRGSDDRGSGGQVDGGRHNVGLLNGHRPNDGRSNDSHAISGLSSTANRHRPQQARRNASYGATPPGSPDSSSLPGLPGSPTMTVAEWENEDEDVAKLSLGASASFEHEAEDLIDMA